MAAADKEAAFSPSLTSNSHCGSSTNANRTNYQNVVQKGKLILPTALWILIVVGGICFLGLLSSLNKTMSTLDTLVEIEQANAVYNKNDYLNHHHHQRHRQREPSSPKANPTEPSDDEAAPTSDEKDWFSFPKWASLERKPTEKSESKARSMTGKSMDKSMDKSSLVEGDDDSLNSIIEKALQASAMNEGPIEGKITVIGIGGNADQNPNDAMKESKILNSMISDLFAGNAGLFPNQGLINQPIKPMKVEASNSKAEPATSGISVTANIDKLNININTAADDDERGEDDHQLGMIEKSNKKERRKKLAKENQENELSQSIDNLVADLLGRNNGPSNHEEQRFGHHHRQPVNPFHMIPLRPHPIAPYLMHLDGSLDKHSLDDNKPQFHGIIRPDRFHPRHRPILPISELMVPFEPMPQPHSPLDSSIPPMFGRPMSRLVIKLSGSDEAGERPLPPINSPTDDNLKPPMELLGNLLSTTIKPLAELTAPTQIPSTQLPSLSQPINSPLDFDIAHKAPRFKLDESMSKPNPMIFATSQPSPLSGLIQALQNTPTEGLGNPQKNDVESMVFINGQPLMSDNQLSESSLDDQGRMDGGGKSSGKIPHNQVNDLFQLFFGPPPDSKLVVAPQISPPNKFDIITSDSSKKDEEQDENEKKKIKKDDDDEITTNGLFGELNNKHKKEKNLHPADEEPLISKAIVGHISSKDGLNPSPSGEFDPLVDDVLGAMFALPQMTSKQDPIKVDSEPNELVKGE